MIWRSFIGLVAIVLMFTVSIARAEEFPQVAIFIDADKNFVDAAGSEAKATAFINELIAKVDALYRAQVGLTIRISGIHLWTTEDPFDRTNQSTFLASFSQYSEANYRPLYTYDAAHLLVGRGLGGEGGIAYSGAACGDSSSAPFAYGLSQPDLKDTYEFNTHLFSHELGHLLNSEHDAFPACAVKTVMCEAQIGGNFSNQSKTEIAQYVSSRQTAGCFPSVTKSDPVKNVKLKLSISKTTVSYRITGGQGCTSLRLVGSPSLIGLKTIFGYLELGKVTPATSVTAVSKNALALKGSGKLFIGAYCDGQLAPAPQRLSAASIQSSLFTTSSVLALRRLQKGFRRK